MGGRDWESWHPPAPHPSTFCRRPDGLMYQKFRNQFLSFSMYQSECLRGPCSAQDLPGAGGEGPGKDLGLQPSPDTPTPQALCSSSSITTRVAACTACGPWARGTPWISLWVGQVWSSALGPGQGDGRGKSFPLNLCLGNGVFLPTLVIRCPAPSPSQRASSPGCGGASPSCCPFFSLDM